MMNVSHDSEWDCESPCASSPRILSPRTLEKEEEDEEEDQDQEQEQDEKQASTTTSSDEAIELPPDFEHANRVPWGAWVESDMSVLLVRGVSYMTDGIKIPAARPMMRLAHVDMFATNTKIENIGARNDSYAYIWYKQEIAKQPNGVWSKEALQSPMLIMNFVFPGKNTEANLVCYFVPREPKSNTPSPSSSSSSSTTTTTPSSREQAFEKLYAAFINGSDEFRNSRFKIIPRIAEGSWFVRKAIGHRPALLAQKITCKYFHDTERNYFEISCDVTTSRVAGKILQLVKGYATTLFIDLSFLIQGECPEELPESLIGGYRLYYPDIDKFKSVDETGNVHETSIPDD